MSFGGQTPTIIVLKEGTDASQGKGQIISNIQACLAVQDTIRSTLGPYGGDLLLVDENGRQTITNDGATVMKVCRRFALFQNSSSLSQANSTPASFSTSFIQLLAYSLI